MSFVVRASSLTLLIPFLALPASAAEPLDYSVADAELKVIKLDSAPTESFLGIKVDTTGRLFVGGREALFVYEPDANGGYKPRQQLLKLPDHTWIYDIEIRGDDLYILTVTALYIIPGGRIEREGLQAHRLVWGVPSGHVHQCFHGMTWGPEGDLYLSMGDPLWYYGDFNRPDHWGHWTFFSRKPAPTGQRIQGLPLRDTDWAKTPYNGAGGVFRCRPDGSGLQVVARGLRNSCGLAFDRDWNLFTNDNDHESMPAEYVPGRLNHVVPHAYFSWPRGWMLTKSPDRMDLLDTMNTSLGRFVPVGQAYYDDTYLPAKYRNALLVARWCTRQITYYPLERKGATFKCSEHELLAGRDLARPVHVTVGRGGRLFASICYMAHNEGSPVYKSDLVMITRADDPDDHPFEAYDAPTVQPHRLFAELENPSWSRRKEAHVELLRRGGDVLREAQIRLFAWINQEKPARPDVQHLVWLTAAAGTEQSIKDLRSLAIELNLSTLAESGKPVHSTVIRALGESEPAWSLKMTLNRAFELGDLPLQHACLVSLMDQSRDLPPEVQQPVLRSIATGDTYLRQAGAFFMAEKATVDALGNLLQSGDPPARLAAVLAAGFRLTIPPAIGELSDDLPLAPWRAPEESYVIQYADGKVDLREHGRLGTFTVADHWKAGKHSAEQEQLFALLAARLADEDDTVRLQAAHFLYMLNDERTEPIIALVRGQVQQARLGTAPINAVSTAWAIGPFADEPAGGWNKRRDLETAPFDPAVKFSTAGQPAGWKKIKFVNSRYFDFKEEFGAKPETSCYLFLRIESAAKQRIELLVGSDDWYKVALNGAKVSTSQAQRGALPIQDVVPLDLQPGSNDLLVRVRGSAGDCRLYLHTRALQPIAVELPEPLAGKSLAERLKEAAGADQNQLDPKFLDVNWDEALKTGSAENGKKLFSANGLACAKCHADSAESAVTGGPSLADAARRFTVAHIVESVLLPNKTISPVFKATTIVTKEGKTYTGLVTGETGQKLEMILSDTNKVTIPIADIDERALQNISPMPAGLVKTPDELRDLLAYLLKR